MVITPKQAKFSAQADRLIEMLIGDIVNQSPNWFSESLSKPPNRAIQDGIAREAESRRWYSMEYNVDCLEVGFCLSDCGRMGCSPDFLVGEEGIGELKNPQLSTHSRYLLHGGLLEDYRPQVHMQLLVTGRQWCDLISYAPPLPPLVIRVVPNQFTEALREALAQFLDLFARAKQRLGIPERVDDGGEILA